MKSTNLIARIFSAIAIATFILGGIGSIIIIANTDEIIGLACVISVFVTGMLFLALSEIINLLQICADNTAKQPKFFTSEASIIADIESELPTL
jgi:hypothetical protein